MECARILRLQNVVEVDCTRMWLIQWVEDDPKSRQLSRFNFLVQILLPSQLSLPSHRSRLIDTRLDWERWNTDLFIDWSQQFILNIKQIRIQIAATTSRRSSIRGASQRESSKPFSILYPNPRARRICWTTLARYKNKWDIDCAYWCNSTITGRCTMHLHGNLKSGLWDFFWFGIICELMECLEIFDDFWHLSLERIEPHFYVIWALFTKLY